MCLLIFILFASIHRLPYPFQLLSARVWYVIWLILSHKFFSSSHLQFSISSPMSRYQSTNVRRHIELLMIFYGSITYTPSIYLFEFDQFRSNENRIYVSVSVSLSVCVCVCAELLFKQAEVVSIGSAGKTNSIKVTNWCGWFSPYC